MKVEEKKRILSEIITDFKSSTESIINLSLVLLENTKNEKLSKKDKKILSRVITNSSLIDYLVIKKNTTTEYSYNKTPENKKDIEIKSNQLDSEFVSCIEKCKIYFKHQINISAKNSPKQQLKITSGFFLYRIIDRFESMSSSSLGIINNGSKNGDTLKSIWINSLSGYLEAASYFPQTMAIINKLPKIKLESYNGNPFIVNYHNRKWDVTLLPSEFKDINYILINDATNELKNLKISKNISAIISFLAFLFVLLVLFLMLKGPLNHLKAIGNAMPLLGMSRFKQLRDLIGPPPTKINKKDEISLIHRTSYQVSLHLEQLENDLKKNTEKLASALDKSSKQRELFFQLLNHSQVLVIALTDDYQIVLVNQLASQYALKKSDLLKPNNLQNLFGEKESNHLLHLINSAKAGDKPTSIDSSIINQQGEEHWINWISCKLPKESENDAQFLLIGIDITYRRLTEQRIRHMAEYDMLTELHNRRTFTEKLVDLSENIKEKPYSLALLFLDLDRFKQINDRFGHHMGDELLKSVAKSLKEFSPPGSIIGRMGGDEFAILLILDTPQKDEAYTELSAELLVKKISSIELPNLPSRSRSFGVSIGIALSPQHSIEKNQLFAYADLAMYSAKQSKDSSVAIYSSNIPKRLESIFDKRRYIKYLISDDKLNIILEPIYDINTLKIKAFECLTRVTSSEQINSISASQLFHFSAECEMSAELDLHIFKTLLKKIGLFFKNLKQKEHTNEYFIEPDVRISFNLSGQTIVQPNFYQNLKKISEAYHIDLDSFIFEVTETENLDDINLASNTLSSLRNQGAMIALDDFGDGFAGLKYLKNLPLDWVKIDGQFIQNITTNDSDRVIVNTIMSAAQQMNFKVLAECVETYEVLDYLKQTNLDMFQGWLFDKGIPLDDLTSETGLADLHHRHLASQKRVFIQARTVLH